MNKQRYIVSFVNNKTVYVRAFTKTEARILAQALMINNALDYDVLEVRETTDSFFECETDYQV